MRRGALVLLWMALIIVSCTRETVDESPPLFKTPSGHSTEVTFANTLAESDSLNILDYLYFYNGGGVAVGDINNDGLQDIYLSGNQVQNKLYLNEGNLKFTDITTSSKTGGNNSWSTGAIMFDANADGYLDIYVRAVVGINDFTGHDELFINNGDGTFTEQAEAYGLDFKDYGTTAAVLDYDLDGDLDIYLLNHAIHTESSFGKASLRNKRTEKTGDKLLRNDGNRFTDVSEQMGIYGGINGYGLGISVADFNQDGWPDIYVGNDFHEDDYYYINEGGVRFRESLKEHFPHTSRFSMGNDNSDLNGDGFPDIISLDMLPDDEVALKASEGDDNIQTQKLRTERFGYHYQFTRNMLFVNQPGYQFKEQALSSGIAATDWSWSALFADFDHDGLQDLFIANGIPKRPNNLDFINFISSDKIQNRINESRLLDNEALDLMPSGATPNRLFKGDGDLNFTDKSQTWLASQPSVSGASALADLDNDGDLDIVVNNINKEATLYINQTDTTATSVQLKFEYTAKNPFGIGTKVFAYAGGKTQYKELYTARGFQASSQPLVHFGLPKNTTIDSLKVIWPDNTYQTERNITTNSLVKLSPRASTPFDYHSLLPKNEKLFSKTPGNLGIDYTHKEDAYIDFNRQKLIPYQLSDRGPATAVGDINNDGVDDIYFGSSKFTSSQIYLGGDSAFAKAYIEPLKKQSKTEDKTAIIQDGKIIVGTAGADFSATNTALGDYILKLDDSLSKQPLNLLGNTSVIAPNDYDNDGDMDLFIGHQVITGDFGTAPESVLLKNNNGKYTVDKNNNLGNIGMVTDAVWTDLNDDNQKDLIVIGEWMEPQFYINNDGVLSKEKLTTEMLTGLWQTIAPFDIDDDGDLDYLLGNWGTNSKFTATEGEPLKMYHADFDNNGQTETLVATSRNGNYYPIQNLPELATQLVSLKKKYSTNNDFAGKTISEIIGAKSLSKAQELNVTTLKSGYLKNEKGSFTFVPFPSSLQVAPLLDFVVFDFTNDGKKEALVGGNYFGTKPYHGRLDSFSGALIKSEQEIIDGYTLGVDFAQKSVRKLSIITHNNINYLLVTFNNEPAQVYTIETTQ
ncbi:VCBS repeat-containing protein [Dokdonia sp. Asnod2-E02]|uniref:VCBS repeat-containing protein n=1 Tax=Dokdonia sp. Asnod2-E02 TaxID=3160574 RepID=UPI00386C0853